MKLRFRFLAALFALIGLLAFVVEGAWASSCLEAAEMEMAAAPAIGAVAPGASCMVGMALPHADAPSETQSDGSQAPHCPLTVAAGSCAGALSLPSESAVSLAPSPEGADLVISPDQARDLLLASAFFRPPRA